MCDRDLENAALSNDTCEAETVVAQKDANLSTYPDSGAALIEESERDDKNIQLLKLNDNEHFSEPASRKMLIDNFSSSCYNHYPCPHVAISQSIKFRIFIKHKH